MVRIVAGDGYQKVLDAQLAQLNSVILKLDENEDGIADSGEGTDLNSDGKIEADNDG